MKLNQINANLIPRVEYEIDYTEKPNTTSPQSLIEWCLKYGCIEAETETSGSITRKYKAKPTNKGKSLKFMLPVSVPFWLDKDLTLTPPREFEGMYRWYVYLHLDSRGKGWWAEKPVLLLEFKTTLHQ